MPENDNGSADFAGVIQGHAENLGDREAFAFIRGERIADTVSYAQLDRDARRIASWLHDRRLFGERVLLLHGAGLDFVTAFAGCLYAGAVAVPAPLPGVAKTQVDRAWTILRDADVSAVLTDSASLPIVADWLRRQGLPNLPFVATDDAGVGDPTAWSPPRRSYDLALLQYTSGSTSEPKGVLVSHANLLHNTGLIQRTVGGDTGTRGCGWLPTSHDMGLIGQLLWTIYIGGWCLLMPPVDFLKRPYRWLELIDTYGANSSAAPNFAYDLCVRTVTDQQLDRLDLSRWTICLNGAEPIRAATLRAFAERFAPAGFRPETFLPCYGMAEATLFVSGDRTARRPVITHVDSRRLARDEFRPADAAGDTCGDACELVSSGRVVDLDVRIVHPETAEVLPDGRVGEIWVRGDSVAQGYWRKDEATRETFHARAANGDGGFLRTGDLGVRHAGELYVTGRIKDLLIVHGRNVYPQDVEHEVRACHPALEAGAGAVFTLPEPPEEAVVVQEIRVRGLDEEEIAQIAATVKRSLAQHVGISVPNVVLVRLGTVRKTTSGKVQRSLMRRLFMSNELQAVHEVLSAEAGRRYRPVMF